MASALKISRTLCNSIRNRFVKTRSNFFEIFIEFARNRDIFWDVAALGLVESVTGDGEHGPLLRVNEILLSLVDANECLTPAVSVVYSGGGCSDVYDARFDSQSAIHALL